MGILLCEQNFRDVWRRNKSVRAEIGQIFRTHTHAAKLVVEMSQVCHNVGLHNVTHRGHTMLEQAQFNDRLR